MLIVLLIVKLNGVEALAAQLVVGSLEGQRVDFLMILKLMLIDMG
jgi:hypothetical protein